MLEDSGEVGEGISFEHIVAAIIEATRVFSTPWFGGPPYRVYGRDKNVSNKEESPFFAA